MSVRAASDALSHREDALSRPHWCVTRGDAPRRKHVRSRAHTRCNAYPRRVYLALSSSPSASCRRHSARPPRERETSSLRGLINDHWVFQRRRNHLHLFARYLARAIPSLPLCGLRMYFFSSFPPSLCPFFSLFGILTSFRVCVPNCCRWDPGYYNVYFFYSRLKSRPPSSLWQSSSR